MSGVLLFSLSFVIPIHILLLVYNLRSGNIVALPVFCMWAIVLCFVLLRAVARIPMVLFGPFLPPFLFLHCNVKVRRVAISGL